MSHNLDPAELLAELDAEPGDIINAYINRPTWMKDALLPRRRDAEHVPRHAARRGRGPRGVLGLSGAAAVPRLGART